MKRVISLQYGDATLLDVAFKQERRGSTLVGVALVENDVAKRFQERDDFEVEDVALSEITGDFLKGAPVLAPQKAALVAAGLDSNEKILAHDFGKTPVPGIGTTSVSKLVSFLQPSGKPDKADTKPPAQTHASHGKGGKTKPAASPPADPPVTPETQG